MELLGCFQHAPGSYFGHFMVKYLLWAKWCNNDANN